MCCTVPGSECLAAIFIDAGVVLLTDGFPDSALLESLFGCSDAAGLLNVGWGGDVYVAWYS